MDEEKILHSFLKKKKKVKTTKLFNRKAENHKESLAQIKLMLEI